MKKKELLVPMYLSQGKAVVGPRKEQTIGGDGDCVRLANTYKDNGADAILIFDQSDDDAEHELSISTIRNMVNAVDIPIYAGGNIKRSEDVKKLLYAGCRKVFLNYNKKDNIDLTEDVSKRFGKDSILASVWTAESIAHANENKELLNGVILLADNILLDVNHDFETIYMAVNVDLEDEPEESVQQLTRIFCNDVISGIYETEEFIQPDFDFIGLKKKLNPKIKNADGAMNTFDASVSWDELKLDSNGLLPVVVQDYKTAEVLMVAYMNQEAYETTVNTGKMTYWSRSRQELWIKGETSGHYQYVKELFIDCDKDTLLAKVEQIGAACHTGNRSCFYTSIQKREDYDATNPLKVFENVMAVIEDRKVNPKEGSYTNYLFSKGIDKILKKVGEEATEIVIAAKNPDSEEVKYEMADFLYHMMVLMAEKGLNWDDITLELTRRE